MPNELRIVEKLTRKLQWRFKVIAANSQINYLSLLQSYCSSVAVWLPLRTLLEVANSVQANNSFAVLKHVVTRRYSLTSVVLCNVKSHLNLWPWLWVLWFLYFFFSRPLVTCSYRISGKVNFNYSQVHQSVLSSTLMLCNLEGWSHCTHTHTHTHIYIYI